MLDTQISILAKVCLSLFKAPNLQVKLIVFKLSKCRPGNGTKLLALVIQVWGLGSRSSESRLIQEGLEGLPIIADLENKYGEAPNLSCKQE